MISEKTRQKIELKKKNTAERREIEKKGKWLKGIHKHFDNQYEKAHKINIKGLGNIQGERQGQRERKKGWIHKE